MPTTRFRALVVTLLTTASTVATTLVTAESASAAMPTISFARAIERLAPYQPQTTCSPTAKPGTVALRAMVLRAFPGTRDSGITRACSIGGRSEHKEGRAWDWGVRFANTTERAKANAFLTWLLKTDKYGNTYANARRLGVQYVIWNKHIWGSYSPGWKPYTGSDPHTSHVHISLSWPGARKQTSFWTKGTPYAFPITQPHDPGTGIGDDSGVRYPEPRPLPQPNPVPTGPALENETISLSAAAGAGVASQGVLTAGDAYRITVSGVINYGHGDADAECSTAVGDRVWRRQRSIVAGHSDWDTLDAYLNGYDIQGRPVADDGHSCSATHTYTWEFQAPTTDKARLRLWDPISYKENTGRLVATIEHLTPSDGDTGGTTGGSSGGYVTAPTTFVVDSASPQGSSTGLRVQAGHSYDLTFTGTFGYGGGSADAECSTTSTDSRWIRTRDFGITTGDRDLLDLKLGWGVDPLSGTATGAACDVTAHTYTWRWTPDQDQPLRAFVYDTDYSDNTGQITVSVVPA